MNEKTKKIVGIVVSVVGICIALVGIRIKVTDPQSSGTMMTWFGVAIAFVGVFLTTALSTSKK